YTEQLDSAWRRPAAVRVAYRAGHTNRPRNPECRLREARDVLGLIPQAPEADDHIALRLRRETPCAAAVRNDTRGTRHTVVPHERIEHRVGRRHDEVGRENPFRHHAAIALPFRWNG